MAIKIPRFHVYLMMAFLWLAFLPRPVPAQNPSAAFDDPSINARVEALLKQMSLEEKVGQLVQRVFFAGMTGPGGGKKVYRIHPPEKQNGNPG